MSKTVTTEELFKSLELEKQWAKKYPVLNFFKRLWFMIVYVIPRILFTEIPYTIKKYWQRGKNGWAISDTWSFDYFLAKTISEGTAYLANHHIGHPTEVKDQEWKDILLEISYTFSTAKKILDNEIVYIPSENFTEEEYNRYKKIFEEKEYASYVLTREEVERFEKGFDLFKKYFFNLWD